jgi:D-sedoheptulose 7-phosphate isomerase
LDQFLKQYFDKMSSSLHKEDPKKFLDVAEAILATSKNGGKTIVAGNGGSAAIASHVSVDLTKAAGIRSVNFNEADLLTCFSNDYGYENWLSKSLEFYADSNDFVVLISSSGSSPNILNAAEFCQHSKIKFATLSGFSPKNPLKEMGNYNFYIDSNEYNIVEMTHHIWLLAIVDFIIEGQMK